MTSNVPEVIPTRELAPVAQVDTDSWTEKAAAVVELAETISGTPFVPKGLRDSVPATAAAILYGREIGLPPMTALQSVYVVDGKPTVSAERMRAMVLAAGHEIEVLETTGAVCVMRGRRRGSDRWSPNVGWTLDMARAAGLAGKNTWQHYPRAMLLARATTDLCRMVFPDVIAGFRTTEELEDIAGDDDAPDSGFTATHEPARKVRRTRKTAAVPAGQPPALEAPSARPDAPAGPPLPGEPGYDTSAAADTDPGAPESTGSDSPAAAAPDLEEGEPMTAQDQPGPVSGEDIEARPSSGAVDPGPAEDGEDAPDSTPEETASPESHSPRSASRAQQRMLLAMLGGFGVDTGDRAERLTITGTLVGRSLSSYDDLTAHEAHQLIDTLGPLETDRAKLDAILDELEQMPAVDDPA